ncbi:MAG: PAS domain S-box protein, partial [Planctomycetales bacterium]
MHGLPEHGGFEPEVSRFPLENSLPYQSWLEHLPVAAYACDAEGLITYFNRKAVEVWGREPLLNDPRDRYCGSFRLFTVEGDAIPRENCWMALGLRNRRAYTKQEVIIQREDGHRIHALAHVNPLFSEKGDLTGAVNILIDLSERREIETALQNFEARYSSLVDNIDGIVWEVDARDMRFLFVSKQAERILGYPLHRWLDEPTFWQDHIHPEDREFAISYCMRETKRGLGHKFEYRMLAADGRIVWLHDFVSVELENNEPVTLRGVMVDITDRKTAEQNLRESEEKFATVFHKLPVPLSITEIEDGMFVDLNEEVLRISGYTKPEILGRTSRDLGWITEEERSRVKQALSERGRVDDMEITLLTKQQEHLLGLMSVRVVKIGGHDCLISTMQDITARKQAEIKLRESEEKFAKVFRDAPILFAITDFETGMLVDFNDEALRVSGFQREDVIGKSSLEIGWISPGERERMKDAIARDGRFENMEVEFHGKDRRKIIGLVSGEQVVIEERSCLLTAMVDITPRRQAQELLAFQNRVLEMLATGFPLTDILTELTRSVETMEPAMRASILLFDPEDQRLRHGAAPSLPREYVQLIDGVKIGEGVGSCGTAAWRRKPVIVEDIESDPLWADFKELGRTFGFRACWSSPILTHQGEVLGTFALYYAEPTRPTSHQEYLVSQATHLAAIAIHNRRREQALYERQAHLIASQRISKVGSWELDLSNPQNLDANRLRWTDEVYRIMGYNPEQVVANNDVFWARVHPDDRPRIETSIRQALETQSIYEIEHRVVLEDG